MYKLFLILLFLLLLTSLSPGMGNLILNPVKGIEDVVLFGDEFNMEKFKLNFGELSKMEDYGINVDGVSVKEYDFKSDFCCVTANNKLIQIWLYTDKIPLDSGIRIGSTVDEIRNKYGLYFITRGNPLLYGKGVMIYNLYPNHIISFTVNKDGKCTEIMSADCALIYKISPSNSILEVWDAPFNIKKPETAITDLTISKDSSKLDGNFLVIKGEVTNNTNREIRYVQVTAIIYDRSGQIIDSPCDYVEETNISPGGSGYFTIITSKGDKAGRYELKVTGE